MSEDSWNSSYRDDSYGEDSAPSVRRNAANNNPSPELKNLRKDVDVLRREVERREEEQREIQKLKNEKLRLQQKLDELKRK